MVDMTPEQKEVYKNVMEQHYIQPEFVPGQIFKAQDAFDLNATPVDTFAWEYLSLVPFVLVFIYLVVFKGM